MIGIHAKMNEKIIHQLTKEEGLTVGADYAAEEIRKLLGPRLPSWSLCRGGDGCAFYIQQFEYLCTDGLCHGAEVQSSMKKNGISMPRLDRWRRP